ncbi:hypothetical protein [Salinibacter altiplanensis]|uniref:hypothetical protein n=1 Tax=Salinibacter altiplanensis TaxID=1803181 RepID=UPI000C9FE415|nr:hypothetical protein [Salinibacter altiplanensis]
MNDETRRGGSGLYLVVALLATLGAAPCSLFGQEAPGYLSPPIHDPFNTYAQQPPDRAFALGPGGWGTAHGQPSLQTARDIALANCREHVDQCVVIAENETIVRRKAPFPDPVARPTLVAPMDAWSAETALLLALSGLLVLVLGTVVAAQFPLYLFDTGLSDVLKIRMNYTLFPFGALYFFCMLPTFFRAAQRDFSTPFTWALFAAPMLPYLLVVWYLYERGALFERFELD